MRDGRVGDDKEFSVKVAVDTARCVGHARCNVVAPQAFDLDDDGYAVVIAASGVSAEDLHSAADSCPERAITVSP
jgi:ferredoxin